MRLFVRVASGWAIGDSYRRRRRVFFCDAVGSLFLDIEALSSMRAGDTKTNARVRVSKLVVLPYEEIRPVILESSLFRNLLSELLSNLKRSQKKKNRPNPARGETNHDRVEMPSWQKQVFGESVWLRLLSGAGEEGLIRASVPHLCTHRLSKNVCHHHVRRGCPPRRCPRQRRPPVRATRERRARRRTSIPPARLASGPGSQRARTVFAATRARCARADRDRERAHELMRARSSRSASRFALRRWRRMSQGSRDRYAPFAGWVPRCARFQPSRSAIRFERLRNTGHCAVRVRSSPAFR